MQIAGNRCKFCERNIVLSSEGKYCARCGTFAHVACEPQSDCDACGQPFQEYERPEADPMRDAVLPRALRPASSGGLLMISLMALMVILIFLIWRFLQ
jgi:hypothetical protein